MGQLNLATRHLAVLEVALTQYLEAINGDAPLDKYYRKTAQELLYPIDVDNSVSIVWEKR